MPKPPPHRRPRDPFRNAQGAPQIRRPTESPLAAEMEDGPEQPTVLWMRDWDLVVCIRIKNGEPTARVHGRRTRKAGKALRIVAAETERWEEP